MGDVHYMISEAAKQVNVETHVLRYWEDELSLSIGRTEMGHRYYTKEDIQLFCCIRELKEQGIQLKELKSLIPDMIHTRNQLKLKRAAFILPPESTRQDTHDKIAPVVTLSETKESETPDKEQMDKLLRIHSIIQEAVRDALSENNEVLSQTVIKGMDFLLQAKERQEEERYKQLDNLIRRQQESRRESAKTSPLGKLRKLLEA